MNRARTTTRAAVLLALLGSACITPIPDVTDLTSRNADDARALSSLQDESLDAFRDFVRDVETRESLWLDEARERVSLISERGLDDRMSAYHDGALARFDSAAWQLLGEEFPARLEARFLAPLRASLESETTALERLASDVMAYPEDRRVAHDYQVARTKYEGQRREIASAEAALRARAGELVGDSRSAFAERLRAAFAARDAAAGDDAADAAAADTAESESLDGSADGAAVEIEVDTPDASFQEPSEPEPAKRPSVDYTDQVGAIDRFEIATRAMYGVHRKSLETVDRYLRGDRVTFLFRDGDVSAIPVPRIAPPELQDLGLGELLSDLAEREAQVERLAVDLRAEADRRVAEVAKALDRELTARYRAVLESTQLREGARR